MAICNIKAIPLHNEDEAFSTLDLSISGDLLAASFFAAGPGREAVVVSYGLEEGGAIGGPHEVNRQEISNSDPPVIGADSRHFIVWTSLDGVIEGKRTGPDDHAQVTFRCELNGRSVFGKERTAGIHCIGHERLVCVKGSGEVFSWNMSKLTEEAVGSEIEPHESSLLQRLASDPKGTRSRLLPTMIRKTCLLPGPPPSLISSMEDGFIGFFDLETSKCTRQFLGSLLLSSDLAIVPDEPHLFGSSSFCSVVKIYDLRARTSSAAITLLHSEYDAELKSLAFSPSSGGLMVFAGGTNESIWAWDLRGSACRPAYELSTGNSIVTSLRYDAGSNSLFAACVPIDYNHDSKEDEEDEEDSDDEGGGKGRFWPLRARHMQSDFSHYYRLKEPKILRYHFTNTLTRMEV